MKPSLLFLMLSTFLAFFTNAVADPLKVGDAAPTLNAVTDSGQTVTLADIYPKGYTLVYFYPKADTGGCTAQGCSLRDAYDVLGKKGVTVVGVSHDDKDAQKAFKEKYHFPFTLIADRDEAVSKAFGVPNLPATSLTSRQAYLINKEGKIVWADYKASTKEQAADVLKALAALEGGAQ